MARRVILHYNKPASLKSGKTKWTVHFRNACHIVDDISVNIPLTTRARKKQPRAVLVGKAEDVRIVDGVAHIE